MFLSLVFSFRNEEEVLSELVRRLDQVLNSIGEYELIFVNDCSTDNSLLLLQALRTANKRIKILNMTRPFGVTPCVLAGLAEAKGDAVIYMDSDLQDPPEVIPDLVKKWEEGADVVHTIRTGRDGESIGKIFLTKVAYKIIRLFSDIELIENAGDFKLLSRRAVSEILKLREFDPYMRGLSVWIGLKQEKVFYQRDPRFAGQSKFGLLSSINPYREFIRGVTSFSSLPLYFALLFGFFVSVISFVFLGGVLIYKLLDYPLPGWTAIMTAILFLGGTILFTIGVLGIYMGGIYNEVKGRPKFVVQEKIGFE